MSKLDAQRAMREARYAARNSSGPTRREAAAGGDTATASATAPAAASKPKKTPAASAVDRPEPAADDQGPRCGHTSMNGRACTRPAGHAEKSHRYA